MPTYDYRCGACQQTFEIFHSINDEPQLRCPSCQQNSMTRLISAGAGIIFKGSGYYVNDARSAAGQGEGAKKKTGPPDAASKPDSKKGGKDAQAKSA